jgi:hypothetical protein
MTQGPTDPLHLIPSELHLGDRPEGECVVCGKAWTDTTAWVAIGRRGWAHVYANACEETNE